MNELIEASLRFPTVIFSIGLGIAVFYWLFVLLGALDIDLLGGGDASGAAKGIGDAMTGGAKGGAEALKGAHHDGGVWSMLGLSNVPVTISISFILLASWCLSLLGMYYGTSALGSSELVALAVLVVALAVALPITGLLVRPIAPVFAVREGKSNKDYIGHICTVTTGHVDDTFGQATVEDGGTVLIISVRCDREGAIQRGHKALIIDFDPARQAYVVEPANDLASELAPT